MHVSLKGFRLDPSGAERLKNLLSGGRSNTCAAGLVDHVLSLGAQHAIVEEPYIDQDYSSDYVTFYAGAFRDYPRHTKRVHLFAEDVSGHLAKPLAEQQAALREAAYVGFIVVRPIAQGPIGRTVLRFPDLGPGLTVRKAARADFKVHLLGSTLEVKSAAPFIQQDERVGSCAQASIWMAARPVHERHRRTGWFSIAEITRLATTPTDAELSRSLPAGSGGLNPIHIIRALRGMGHQPLFDYFVADEAPAKRKRSKAKTAATPPLAAPAIIRYLDSGLPVVIALADLGEKIGHAITAVGFVEAQGPPCRAGATYEAFVRALIVHDDQRGPYRLMPLGQDDIRHLPKERLLVHGQQVLTVESAATHMFVPLPQRVFLPADRADTVVRDFLEQYVKLAGSGMLDRIKTDYGQDAAATVRSFYDLVAGGRLIRRTYLTSAGRYRHHLAQGDLTDEIKAELLVRHLPHFIWVTELISPDDPPGQGDGPRKMLGHMVVNATSSTDPSSDLLVAHLPHVLVHRNVNPPLEKEAPFEEMGVVLETHAAYLGRSRN